MTRVVDNMIDLIKSISNVGSSNYYQNVKAFQHNNYEIKTFENLNIIPISDSIRQITHISSSFEDSNTLADNSDDPPPKNIKNDVETEVFFKKVHSILNKDKKTDSHKNKNSNYSFLRKDDLADIFSDTNCDEKKNYKRPDKNFRISKKSIPKHLIPLWDNRTIVDCDKKQIFTYNYSIDQNSVRNKVNFVQLPKKQDFQWKNSSINSQKTSIKTQPVHNILIYDVPIGHHSFSKLTLTKNEEVFCRKSCQTMPCNSRQASIKKENQKVRKEQKSNTKRTNESHQKNLEIKKSHQKIKQSKIKKKQIHKKPIDQSKKNEQKINNAKDPLCCLSSENSNDYDRDIAATNQSNINDLYLIEEEEENDGNQSQTQVYQYRDVKNIEIKMPGGVNGEIDPIVQKLSSDADMCQEENQSDICKTTFDPLVEGDISQNSRVEPFHSNRRRYNKKFDELCSFDISEVSNKMFYIRRNPTIRDLNEFSMNDFDDD